MTSFDEGPERNKALGIWGAIGGSGAAVGVLAGGILTKYLGWEWIFFVNVPVGAAALLLALSPVLMFMIRTHPFEHLYFNRFAGRDMAEIKTQYELDYWGLSYRTALEYIVRTDPSPRIRLFVTTFPGRANIAMLLPRDRERLALVRTPEEADYFVTHYRFHPEPYPFPWEVFNIRLGNASIISVFASNERHATLQLPTHADGARP